ncbi:MAG TPA: type II toxin-antitoxin system VapC family toxin [Candidatus Eremiobacteraceae bacterium]|nr:type II toxin-antitoxin system VapC family toxin [Candidatus Eremiobacteraceae bacterium]
MRALLDTHALLWWLSDDPSLSKRARAFVSQTENAVIVSSECAWEIATKVRLGKLASAGELTGDFMGYLEREGFETLSISTQHAIRAGLLPGPHKDPFDRMLIAQAQAENLPVLSNDRVFDDYGVRRIW